MQHSNNKKDNVVVKEEKKKNSFIDRIIQPVAPYHKRFCKLKFRKRMERIDDIACNIITSCIDKNDVRRYGTDYVIGNVEFAHKILNVFNRILDRVDSKLKINLYKLEYPKPVELVDDNEETEKDGYVTNWDSLNDETTQMVYGIMGA